MGNVVEMARRRADEQKGSIGAVDLLYGACFSLCFFAFMLTEAFINERCAVLLGADSVYLIYAAGLVCTGLGFLSFSALLRLCIKESVRKVALCLIGLLCLHCLPIAVDDARAGCFPDLCRSGHCCCLAILEVAYIITAPCSSRIADTWGASLASVWEQPRFCSFLCKILLSMR